MRRSPFVRQKAERRGQRGEAFAAVFLRLKLYRVLARRVKTPVGEIDLIAERFGKLVFAEVKSRHAGKLEGEALGAVNVARISRAAAYWLARHPGYNGRDMRFDVIFIAPLRLPRHVINAFEMPE